MCRKSVLVLALVVAAALLCPVGRAYADPDKNRDRGHNGLGQLQAAFAEAYEELQEDPDDILGMYAFNFAHLAQYYFALALQHIGDDSGRAYILAAYEYSYLALAYAYASFIYVGIPRGHFHSYFVYLYAATGAFFAFEGYQDWDNDNNDS